MGTPDFAVPSLEILVKNNYNVVAVITAPDKPAGRGKIISQSDVKKYSLEKGLNILQPTNLKDQNFIKDLELLKADLQVVVAFRMLPEIVWNIPKHGTINLHASLLPQYRGAAPINWAIINGEKQSGVTTFFINNKIDEGNIIFTKKVEIEENETAEELHDKLMNIGSTLLLKTVENIQQNKVKINIQSVKDNSIKLAPKICKEMCRINWNDNIDNIHNFIRGLSPYPAAFTNLISPDGNIFYVKIFKSTKEKTKNKEIVGKIFTNEKNQLKISTKDGLINILEIQLSCKKKMKIDEFLRGIEINNNWKIKQ